MIAIQGLLRDQYVIDALARLALVTDVTFPLSTDAQRLAQADDFDTIDSPGTAANLRWHVATFPQ